MWDFLASKEAVEIIVTVCGVLVVSSGYLIRRSFVRSFDRVFSEMDKNTVRQDRKDIEMFDLRKDVQQVLVNQEKFLGRLDTAIQEHQSFQTKDGCKTEKQRYFERLEDFEKEQDNIKRRVDNIERAIDGDLK